MSCPTWDIVFISHLKEKKNHSLETTHSRSVPLSHFFAVIQSLSHVQLFVTPWTTVFPYYPLSFTIFQGLLKFKSIESVMLSNHLILCYPLLPFTLNVSQHQGLSLFVSGGQSIGVSASTSVLPMNIQDWFPLGLTGLISVQLTGLSRVSSTTTIQKHQFLSSRLSFWSQLSHRSWLLEKP